MCFFFSLKIFIEHVLCPIHLPGRRLHTAAPCRTCHMHCCCQPLHQATAIQRLPCAEPGIALHPTLCRSGWARAANYWHEAWMSRSQKQRLTCIRLRSLELHLAGNIAATTTTGSTVGTTGWTPADTAYTSGTPLESSPSTCLGGVWEGPTCDGFFWDRVSKIICSGLALNHNPPDLCLLSS
jgi:hypothetical protein